MPLNLRHDEEDARVFDWVATVEIQVSNRELCLATSWLIAWPLRHACVNMDSAREILTQLDDDRADKLVSVRSDWGMRTRGHGDEQATVRACGG